MKICLASGCFAPMETGGAERAARLLAEQLAGRGWQVVVIAAGYQDGTEVLPSGLIVHRIRCGPFIKEGGDSLPALRRWAWRLQNVWNPAAYRKARRILAHERPQLVNVHNYAALSPSVFAAVRSRGIPVVFTAHDYFPLCRRYSFVKNGRPCRGGCLSCRLWRGWNRRFLARTPAVHLSEHSRAVYRRHGHDGPSLLWPNPVHLSSGQLAAVAADKAAFRAANPDAPVTWVFMGRLDALKGIASVMRAWELQPASGIRLRIAGDGPLAQVVRDWAARRPDAEYLGFVSGPDWTRLLVEADALLLPSQEGDVSPLVVPEALGHGLPVLGSGRGALRGLIQPEATGWLCDTDDAGEFSRRIAAIAREPLRLRAMSSGCFAAARERSIAAALPRLLAFFEEIVTAAARNPS